MNIDQRLDRLTERHEALAESIELLTADIREMAAENKKRDEQMGQLKTGIGQLLRIAEIHERRLMDLEGGTS